MLTGMINFFSKQPKSVSMESFLAWFINNFYYPNSMFDRGKVKEECARSSKLANIEYINNKNSNENLIYFNLYLQFNKHKEIAHFLSGFLHIDVYSLISNVLVLYKNNNGKQFGIDKNKLEFYHILPSKIIVENYPGGKFIIKYYITGIVDVSTDDKTDRVINDLFIIVNIVTPKNNFKYKIITKVEKMPINKSDDKISKWIKNTTVNLEQATAIINDLAKGIFPHTTLKDDILNYLNTKNNLEILFRHGDRKEFQCEKVISQKPIELTQKQIEITNIINDYENIYDNMNTPEFAHALITNIINKKYLQTMLIDVYKKADTRLYDPEYYNEFSNPKNILRNMLKSENYSLIYNHENTNKLDFYRLIQHAGLNDKHIDFLLIRLFKNKKFVIVNKQYSSIDRLLQTLPNQEIWRYKNADIAVFEIKKDASYIIAKNITPRNLFVHKYYVVMIGADTDKPKKDAQYKHIMGGEPVLSSQRLSDIEYDSNILDNFVITGATSTSINNAILLFMHNYATYQHKTELETLRSHFKEIIDHTFKIGKITTETADNILTIARNIGWIISQKNLISNNRIVAIFKAVINLMRHNSEESERNSIKMARITDTFKMMCDNYYNFSQFSYSFLRENRSMEFCELFKRIPKNVFDVRSISYIKSLLQLFATLKITDEYRRKKILMDHKDYMKFLDIKIQIQWVRQFYKNLNFKFNVLLINNLLIPLLGKNLQIFNEGNDSKQIIAAIDLITLLAMCRSIRYGNTIFGKLYAKFKRTEIFRNIAVAYLENRKTIYFYYALKIISTKYPRLLKIGIIKVFLKLFAILENISGKKGISSENLKFIKQYYNYFDCFDPSTCELFANYCKTNLKAKPLIGPGVKKQRNTPKPRTISDNTQIQLAIRNMMFSSSQSTNIAAEKTSEREEIQGPKA